MFSIRPARFGGAPGDADLCRTLMREYAAFLNASVGGEHICVASFEQELSGLPGAYSEPAGAILLAFAASEPAGCVALKPLHLDHPAEHGTTDPSAAGLLDPECACEMKRLWVRPAHQGRGLGRSLAAAVVSAARERGYTAMYLDTMPHSMQSAYSLYRSMGFTSVERYNRNPVLRQPESLAIAFLRRDL